MSVAGLMRHRVDLYRPNFQSGATAQTVSGYGLVAASVPCFIQPADSKEEFYYAQRGLELTHVVYTSDTSTGFLRNDVLVYGARQFHVVGVLSGLEASLYTQLTCLEWPEGAKERLDTGAYT